MADTRPPLVFVNRFYWPEETATAQLLTDLAEALAARGRRVTVVTRQVPRPCERNGVRIVGAGPLARNRRTGFVAKAGEFASFWWAARRALQSEAGPETAVIALTDPPLLGVAAAAAAQRTGAGLFHWIQDIYPEVAAQVSAGAPAWGLLRGVRDRAWRQAAGCVTLGRDMAGLVTSRGVASGRLHVQPNWAPAGLRPAGEASIAEVRAAWLGGSAEPNSFVVGYSGNLGRVHDLDAVLAIAEELRGDRGIIFQFTGGGPQRARLERKARELGLANVRFAPPAPRERLAAVLSAADLHLVTLRPGCETCVFPSKLYGAAAVGRPILFLGPRDCEIARLIEGAGMGRAFASPEALGAAAATVRAFRDDAELRRSASAAALAFGAAHSGPARAAEFWDALTSGVR